MEEAGISDPVKHFLNDHISSVGQLEMLLLLQTNPQQAWTVEEIARNLRTETGGTQPQLELLVQSGLIKRDDAGRYSYAPTNDALHSAAVALAQAYLTRRVTIISLIFAKPPDALRAFSNAFRLRKDPTHMTRLPEVVYLLCALASIACALLLARGYHRSKARILLWSTACFALLALNNLLLFLDLVILTAVDLSPLRDLSGVLAVVILVFGLIWDAE